MSVVSLLYYTTTLIATFAILYHTCPPTRLAHHCWLGVWNMVVFFSTQLSDEVICLERGAVCLHMVQLMPLHPKTPTPSSLASFKSRLVLPFWYQLTQVFLGKRPFSSSSSSSSRNNIDSTFYCNVTEKMFCVPCLCHSLLRQRCIQLFR